MVTDMGMGILPAREHRLIAGCRYDFAACLLRATGITNRIEVRRGENAAILLSTRPADSPALCTSVHVNGKPSSSRNGFFGKATQSEPAGASRFSSSRDLHHQPVVRSGRPFLDALDERPEDLAQRPPELGRLSPRVGGTVAGEGEFFPRSFHEKLLEANSD
jgi:hypothetical protein